MRGAAVLCSAHTEIVHVYNGRLHMQECCLGCVVVQGCARTRTARLPAGPCRFAFRCCSCPALMAVACKDGQLLALAYPARHIAQRTDGHATCWRSAPCCQRQRVPGPPVTPMHRPRRMPQQEATAHLTSHCARRASPSLPAPFTAWRQCVRCAVQHRNRTVRFSPFARRMPCDTAPTHPPFNQQHISSSYEATLAGQTEAPNLVFRPPSHSATLHATGTTQPAGHTTRWCINQVMRPQACVASPAGEL